AKIDVNIRRRDAIRIQETLENQSILERIDIGNAKHVCDKRTRSRSTARADRNAALFGEVDEIPNDQYVADESGLLEYPKFIIEALLQLTIAFRSVAVTLQQTFGAKITQIGFAGDPLWDGILRILRFSEFNLQIAALGDFQSVRDRFRKIAEDFAHFLCRFEIEFRFVTHPVFVLHHFPRADAKHYIVCVVVAPSQEMDIVCGDQSDPQLLGDFWQNSVALPLLFHPMVMHLHEEIFRSKDIAILSRALFGDVDFVR